MFSFTLFIQSEGNCHISSQACKRKDQKTLACGGWDCILLFSLTLLALDSVFILTMTSSGELYIKISFLFPLFLI